MTQQQLDAYCDIVARGDFAAADAFMEACLRLNGSPGVKAPAATPPDCCPQCMGEGWVELKRLCKKHGSGVDSSRTTEPKGGA
jgi:hypothetical protein